MTKVRSMKGKVREPGQTDEAIGSEVSDLLKTIEEMGRKAGCMLDTSKDSLAYDEMVLLEDVQALGARAEHLMEQKMVEAEALNQDEFIISKSLSKTDIGYHLTLTSVEEKLNELHVLWGQHGQVLEVTDLMDNAEMEFTFVIWSHHKGRRGVLTGAWKLFCRKHGLRVGDEISITSSDLAREEYILRAGKNLNPLAVLKCKKEIPIESGDHVSTHSTTASGEASSLDNMHDVAGESRDDLASMEECGNEKFGKTTEDEKIIELADYLFKLSRWGSPLKNPRTS